MPRATPKRIFLALSLVEKDKTKSWVLSPSSDKNIRIKLIKKDKEIPLV